MVNEFPFETFRPEIQDSLFRCSVAPGNFPLERQEKPCSTDFPFGQIFQGHFDNGIRTKRTYHAIYSPFP